MPAVVTKQWSTETLTPGESAAFVYEVLGAATARQAVDANGVPRAGTRHPEDRLLTSTKPQANRMTPNRGDGSGGFWHVRVGYVAADSDEGKENENEDPLKRLPTYEWRIGLQGVPVDRDIDGNPILNSARQSFSNPPSADVMTLSLVVTQNERGYDINKAFYFHNAVNDDFWRVPGTNQTVAPGQARCLAIRPSGEFNLVQTFVAIQYEFEFQADGFDLRIEDKGTRASGDGTLVQMIDANGQPLDGVEVILNGYGHPLDTDITVEGGGKQRAFPPKGAEVELTSDSVFLKYKRNPRRPFAQMNLR